MAVLVFPSCLQASKAFIRDAKHWNQQVVGASSLEVDPNAGECDSWEFLPYIHEEGFFPALMDIAKRHGIDSIYTPHAPTYLKLVKCKEQLQGMTLRGNSPYAEQMQRVEEAHANIKHHIETAYSYLGKPTAIPAGLLAALLADAGALYGECSQEKMVALAAAFSDAVPGDVIEIGTFFGKSAYVMNRLAVYYGIGAAIAIDPWDMRISIQKDSPDTIQELSEVWDWELVFKGFLLNLEARHAGQFNYIKASSKAAWKRYENATSITSPEFGQTPIKGAISVLHIDGNHDKDAVAEDFALWSPRLAPGSWLIFDDYEWSGGSGPREIADQVRIDWKGRIAHFFVAGGAAFIKLKA